jgi:hypothetical protein
MFFDDEVRLIVDFKTPKSFEFHFHHFDIDFDQNEKEFEGIRSTFFCVCAGCKQGGVFILYRRQYGQW